MSNHACLQEIVPEQMGAFTRRMVRLAEETGGKLICWVRSGAGKDFHEYCNQAG